jgi:hypothetical protein
MENGEFTDFRLLLNETLTHDLFTEAQANSLIGDCIEIKKILVSVIKTTKSTHTRPAHI